MSQTVKCPKCNSDECQILDTRERIDDVPVCVQVYLCRCGWVFQQIAVGADEINAGEINADE